MNQHLPATGKYFLPHASYNTELETLQKSQEEMKGNPWAMISYHRVYRADWGKNIPLGSLCHLIIMLPVCWMLSQFKQPTFFTVLLSCLIIGMAGHVFIPYSLHIWYETPDAMTNLLNTLAAWV